MKCPKYILPIMLSMVSFSIYAQTIHDFNAKLGRGINYGNMLEAPSEGEWGSPWKPEYPEIISSMGFNHVRIPIQWESLSRSDDTAPYAINPTFLARVKEVVDATLANRLMVIINMHHHEQLFDDPDGQKDRFLAQWEQISEFFKDYTDSLAFEILNEPHGNFTAEKWNVFLKDALDVIRIDNPTRAVLVGTAEYGGLGGISSLELPEDDHIILTIHYYNPFQFTHQGAEWGGPQAQDWLGTEWLDTDLERAIMVNEFAPLLELSQTSNVPIHIGEFGAYSLADLASRVRWTTYLSRYFEELGWSWAYWEFSSGFGIYDPNTGAYLTELIEALQTNEMPEPTIYDRATVYESNFNLSLNGWFLNVDTGQGADAQLSRAGNNIKVTINELGTENWHIQLMRSGIALQAGKKYSLTFTGHAAELRPVVFYIGKNSGPWTQYSATSVMVGPDEESFSWVFDMQVDDPSARLAFDLGESLADFEISKVLVEELTLEEPEIVDPILGLEEEKSIRVFPNPVGRYLTISNHGEDRILTLLNGQGQYVFEHKLQSGLNNLDLDKLANGLYYIILSNGKEQKVYKVLHR